VCLCVRACVPACVRACVPACARVLQWWGWGGWGGGGLRVGGERVGADNQRLTTALSLSLPPYCQPHIFIRYTFWAVWIISNVPALYYTFSIQIAISVSTAIAVIALIAVNKLEPGWWSAGVSWFSPLNRSLAQDPTEL
jgi:hypothetical protein